MPDCECARYLRPPRRGPREKSKHCAERQPGSAGLSRDENPGAAALDFSPGCPRDRGVFSPRFHGLGSLGADEETYS
jgi:hypothetical protein